MYKIKEIINTVIQGDAKEVLKKIPSESISMVLTSPPYFGLRNYEVEGQIGMESSFEKYLDNLLEITKELKRVLQKDGTLWWVHGDSYCGSGKGAGKKNYNAKENYQLSYDDAINTKIKDKKYQKCLMMQPYRLAMRMVDEQGFILRNIIVWKKNNQMPSSVTDRMSVDYEPIFFFSKNKNYYFEQQFEPYSPESDVEYRKTLRIGKFYRTKKPYKKNIPYQHKNLQEKGQTPHGMHKKRIDGDREYNYNPKGKNRRAVWEINTYPSPESHFATFPKRLCITPIKAGCPPKGIVLDCFAGICTTGLVAQELGRNYIGIELSEKYCKIARKKLSQKCLF